MTYNEWRDELKNNLLCVSESERRRVLDYYAEAYADRREAGFTEREIIEDFGAPYDAAQRILAENGAADCDYGETGTEKAEERENKREEQKERRRGQKLCRDKTRESKSQRRTEDFEYRQSAPSPSAASKKEEYTWLFILLCIIFCVPLGILIISMLGVTVGLCAAPVIVIISGAATAIGSIVAMALGNAGGGLCAMGIGIIVLGVGVILCPLFFKLVQLLWTLFNKFFAWLKGLFSGKEA